MFCSKCGFKLPDNINFCPKCGTPVPKVAPVVPAQPEPVVEEPVAEAPVVEPVVEEEPAVETPVVEPEVEEPTPVVEEPAVAEEPTVEAPVVESSAEESTVTEEPAVKTPVVEDTANVAEPVVEETVEPVTEEPAVSEAPTVEAPTVETPAAVETPVISSPTLEEDADLEIPEEDGLLTVDDVLAATASEEAPTEELSLPTEELSQYAQQEAQPQQQVYQQDMGYGQQTQQDPYYQEQPVQPAPYYQEQPVQPISYYSQESGQSVYGDAYDPHNIPEPKKKKGKAGLIITIIIVFLLAVAAAVGFYYYTNIYAGPKSQLKKAVVGYVDKSFEENGTVYNKSYAEPHKEKSSQVITASIDIEDGIQQILATTGMDLSWLENASITMKTGADSEHMSMDLIAGINGTDVATGVMAVDYASGMIYVQIPELSSAFISMNANGEDGNAFQDVINAYAALEKGEDKVLRANEIGKVTKKYASLFIDNLDEVEKNDDKEEIKVGKISQNATGYTAVIDEKTQASIDIAIEEEFLQDAELKEVLQLLTANSSFRDEIVIADVAAADYAKTSFDFEKWYGDVKEAVEKDVKAKKEKVKALDKEKSRGAEIGTLTFYTDKKNELIGVESENVLTPDTKEYVYTLKDGEDFAIEYSCDGESASKSITATGSNDGKKVNADILVKENDEESVAIQVVDFDYKEYRKGNLKGEVIVDPAEKGEAKDAFEKQLEQMKYDITFDTQGKYGNIDCKLATDAITYGTIHIVTSDADVDIHDIPSSAIEIKEGDSVGLQQYTETMTFDQLFANLQNAGVPVEQLFTQYMEQRL